MISAKTCRPEEPLYANARRPATPRKEHRAHSQQLTTHNTPPQTAPTMKSAMDEIQSSTKNLTVDATCTDNNADEAKSSASSSSATTQPEFINTGLHQWESIRSDWLASCHPPSSSNKKKKQHAQNIDVDEVIDLIVSNRWRQTLEGVSGGGNNNNNNSGSISLDTARNATKRREDACFDNPVGLPQMVDVLVDLWEAEGLDI